MLLDLLRTQRFEPFAVDGLVDARGRYHLQLDPQFPFAIKLHHFMPVDDTYPLNWHERLEIFVPLSGEGQFRMGDRIIDFAEDDVLVVANLRLHGLREFRGAGGYAMTVTFNSEFIYNIASPLCDYTYLIPFNCLGPDVSPIVRCDDPDAPRIHQALARLIGCYFDLTLDEYTRIGCKAYLLELLFHLTKHFAGAEVAHAEYVRQQERARRLGHLFDHLQEHYADPLSVGQAARMVGMSASRFMRFFKEATGTTFVNYVTQLRLAHACELLRQTDVAVGDIAERIGLCDHAYFDRKFRQHFNMSPRRMRALWSARHVA